MHLQDAHIFNWDVTLSNAHETKIKSYAITVRSEMSKCFAFDTPYKQGSKILGIIISLDPKIFVNKRRPSTHLYGETALGVDLTYPKQVSRSFSGAKMMWPNRSNDSSVNYIMYFRVTSMNVVKYRNKRNDPCFENWKTYDRFCI